MSLVTKKNCMRIRRCNRAIDAHWRLRELRGISKISCVYASMSFPTFSDQLARAKTHTYAITGSTRLNFLKAVIQHKLIRLHLISARPDRNRSREMVSHPHIYIQCLRAESNWVFVHVKKLIFFLRQLLKKIFFLNLWERRWRVWITMNWRKKRRKTKKKKTIEEQRTWQKN